MTPIFTAIRSIKKARGLVLTELIIVLSIIAMMVSITMLSLAGVFGRSEFEKRAYKLISVMKLAYNGAKTSERKYAVVFDLEERIYFLREFVTLDLMTLPEEEAIIETGYFDDDFQLDYIIFDDLDDTRDIPDGEIVTRVSFKAGRAGWQYGGKIVLADGNGNPYSIVLNRLTGNIRLIKGDAEFLTPVTGEELPF